MINFVAVATGGALGAVSRFYIGLFFTRVFGLVFPFGTLVVNISGSFAMGLLMGYFLSRHSGGDWLRLFLMTGFLGGFTTFSAFSMETIVLWQREEIVAMVFYVGASLLLSLGAFVLGLKLVTYWT